MDVLRIQIVRVQPKYYKGSLDMGLVKTRRLAAMQKQQMAKAGLKPPMPKDKLKFEDRRRKPN